MRANLVVKDEKRKLIAQKLLQSNGIFLAEYKGIPVKDLSKIRKDLKQVGSEFEVVKNRIVKKAIEKDDVLSSKYSLLLNDLKGPIGLIYSRGGDPAKVAKIITDFAQENSNWILKGGILEDNVVSSQAIQDIAQLPSKEVLITKILVILKAPSINLLRALTGVHVKLLYVLNAIKEQKSSEGK